MQVTVNGRSLEAAVVKLRPEQEKKALGYLGQDGLDNVVFTLGADTFVASARDLDLKGIQENQLVQFRGQTGRVMKVDSGTDLKSPKRAALWGSLVGAVGFPLTALGLNALFSPGAAMGLGFMAGGAAMGAALFALGGAGLAALNGWIERRHAKKADWSPYGVPQG